MGANQKIIRESRIEVNAPCTLNPWGVAAIIENISMTGAYLICENFPDDLLTSVNGEVVVGNITLPGELIRVNKIKIGIHFSILSQSCQAQLEAYINSFKKV